jgi:hypothetical protein
LLDAVELEDWECAFPEEDSDALDLVFFDGAIEGFDVVLEV